MLSKKIVTKVTATIFSFLAVLFVLSTPEFVLAQSQSMTQQYTNLNNDPQLRDLEFAHKGQFPILRVNSQSIPEMILSDRDEDDEDDRCRRKWCG